MKYLTINPDETVKTKKYLDGPSKTYNFITIENPELLGYRSNGHVFNEPGTYMYDSSWNMKKVTLTDGNEVTAWFRETYSHYYLGEGSVVYESNVVYPETSVTGYHIISNNNDKFISDYNSEYDYFRLDTDVYTVTEDDAVYSGDYVCEEATVVITGMADYSEALFDNSGNSWYYLTTQESETNEIQTTEDAYVFWDKSFENIGNNRYRCQDDDSFVGSFVDGEYIFSFYNGRTGSYYYYPCSYEEEVTEPVTVITSAGTPTAITGTEAIIDMDGNSVHCLIYYAGSWYGRDHIYTGSTFDNMVFATYGSFGTNNFNIDFVKGCQGGKIFEGITPGVAYSEISNNVYYNGGLILKRLNDGKALYVFDSKTVEFNRGFEYWFYHNFSFGGLNDFIIKLSPGDVDSVIVNGTEYKETLDADPDNWTINLVFNPCLHNMDTSERIEPNDGKIKVTFSDEFIKKGKIYVLYASHGE